LGLEDQEQTVAEREAAEPVSKAAVFREFMVPLDLEDDMPVRDAEAALAFLVEQGMVEVAGDEITVPASFWSSRQISPT
jgi:predicted deacylase